MSHARCPCGTRLDGRPSPFGPIGRPHPFQVTIPLRRAGGQEGRRRCSHRVSLRLSIHTNPAPLLGRPRDRARAPPGSFPTRSFRIVRQPATAEAFLRVPSTTARGGDGQGPPRTHAAGSAVARLKLKSAHTLDLVVLAAEWAAAAEGLAVEPPPRRPRSRHRIVRECWARPSRPHRRMLREQTEALLALPPRGTTGRSCAARAGPGDRLQRRAGIPTVSGRLALRFAR
jgi:hypothetical protein